MPGQQVRYYGIKMWGPNSNITCLQIQYRQGCFFMVQLMDVTFALIDV